MRRSRAALPVVALIAVTAGAAAGGRGGPRRVANPAAPVPVLAAAPAPPPPPPHPLVATARVPSVEVFAAPGAAAAITALANPNEFDVPLVFRVEAVQADWLQVMLPV